MIVSFIVRLSICWTENIFKFSNYSVMQYKVAKEVCQWLRTMVAFPENLSSQYPQGLTAVLCC